MQDSHFIAFRVFLPEQFEYLDTLFVNVLPLKMANELWNWYLGHAGLRIGHNHASCQCELRQRCFIDPVGVANNLLDQIIENLTVVLLKGGVQYLID